MYLTISMTNKVKISSVAYTLMPMKSLSEEGHREPTVSDSMLVHSRVLIGLQALEILEILVLCGQVVALEVIL